MIDAAPVSASVSYPWYKVWSQVLFRPTAKTYERILQDPGAKAWRAVLWVGMTSLLVALIGVFLFQDSFKKYNIPGSALYYIIGVPIITIITFLIMTGAYHLITKLLDGQGSYNQMVYACGAYFAPLFPVVSGLYAILFFSFLGFTLGTISDISSKITIGLGMVMCGCLPLLIALGIFSAFQAVFAIRAVEKTTTGKAFLAWLITTVVLYVFGRII